MDSFQTYSSSRIGLSSKIRAIDLSQLFTPEKQQKRRSAAGSNRNLREKKKKKKNTRS